VLHGSAERKACDCYDESIVTISLLTMATPILKMAMCRVAATKKPQRPSSGVASESCGMGRAGLRSVSPNVPTWIVATSRGSKWALGILR